MNAKVSKRGFKNVNPNYYVQCCCDGYSQLHLARPKKSAVREFEVGGIKSFETFYI